MSRVWAFSALLLVACGTNRPEIPPELLEPPSGESEGYPGGPYGGDLSDVAPNLSFEGFTDPEASRFDPDAIETLSLSDYYDPEGEKGITLLLANTAAAWCQPCKVEHQTLGERAAQYRPQGLRVLSALFQNTEGDPAELEDLLLWTELYETDFAMGLDADYRMGVFGSGSTPPLNVVIDTRTMRVVEKFVGNQEEVMWAFIERELEQRER